MDYTDAGIQRVLREMNVPCTPTNVMQFRVMMNAYSKFLERNEEWKDLFRQDSDERQHEQILQKLARQARAVTQGAFEDSALDCINYIIFRIRNRREQG